MSEAFAAGFMDTLNKRISSRLEKGENYFDKQLELARTKGIETKARTDQLKNTGLSTAKQLMQVGVPKDIVMHIANQNPDDLPSFLKEVQELQAEAGDGVLDEEFYRGLYDVAGNVDTNETMEQLFSRIYTPLVNNIKADPETFKGNKKGTILATLLGYNAQEEALDKLENTEVIDGMSAADLLRYNGEPNLGDSTVTMNAGVGGDAIRDIREARKLDEDTTLTRADVTAIVGDYQDLVEQYTGEYNDEIGGSAKDTPDYDENEPKRRAVADLVQMYGADAIESIELLKPYMMPVDEDEEELVEEPVGEDAVTEQKAEGEKVVVKGHTLIKDRMNGTSEWQKPDGTVVIVNNATTPPELGLSQKPATNEYVDPRL